jgi:hypothetical protein
VAEREKGERPLGGRERPGNEAEFEGRSLGGSDVAS